MYGAAATALCVTSPEHDSHINSICEETAHICCLVHIIYIHLLYLTGGSPHLEMC